MAWDDELVAIVRGLIQDYPDEETGDAPKYTDARLADLILISAQNVQARLLSPRGYKVSLDNTTLKPDPTSQATRDDNFINLVSLKAACILVNAEVREFTGQGISVRDGSSAVSLQRSPGALGLMQKTYCGEFETALYAYNTTGGNAPVGEAIVGPVKAWFYGNYGSDPLTRVDRWGANRWEDWYTGCCDDGRY